MARQRLKPLSGGFSPNRWEAFTDRPYFIDPQELFALAADKDGDNFGFLLLSGRGRFILRANATAPLLSTQRSDVNLGLSGGWIRPRAGQIGTELK